MLKTTIALKFLYNIGACPECPPRMTATIGAERLECTWSDSSRVTNFFWTPFLDATRHAYVLGREPGSSGDGRSSWVRIPTPYIFHILICCKIFNRYVFEKTKINEKEAGVGPFKKHVFIGNSNRSNCTSPKSPTNIPVRFFSCFSVGIDIDIDEMLHNNICCCRLAESQNESISK